MTVNNSKTLLFEHFDFIESQCMLVAIKLFRTMAQVTLDHSRDELLLLVIEQLSSNNYEQLQKYNDPKKIKGFLKLVIHRKGIDLQRTKIGRSPLGKLFVELGPIAKEIYFYYIKLPRPIEDVRELLSSSLELSEIEAIADQLQKLVGEMQQKSAAREQTQEIDSGYFTPLSLIKNPQEEAESKEKSTQLQTLLEALQPLEGYAIALRFQDDLKPKEMAKILKISEKSVSNLLYRSLNKLKEIAIQNNYGINDLL